MQSEKIKMKNIITIKTWPPQIKRNFSRNFKQNERD